MRIEVIGHCGPSHSPELDMADMLRYDGGSVESVHIYGRYDNHYTAIVDCERYTKARWDSFSLRTKLL